MSIKSSIFFILIVGSFQVSIAQSTLSLDSCYVLLQQNYPIVKQRLLLDNQTKLRSENLEINYRPQINLAAQITYQSDVTSVPISNPLINIEPPNKDQYKATFNINQMIYDGGTTQAALELEEAQNKVKQKQIDVTLNQLKEQVYPLYFALFLQQEKQKILANSTSILLAKQKEVESAIRNGVSLKNNLHLIGIELLKIKQQKEDLNEDNKLIISLLSKLLNIEINSNSLFEAPSQTVQLNADLNRPELQFFDLQKQQLVATSVMLENKNKPTVAAFLTGGYGNPGLNMLDNSFQPFFLTGIKFKWTVFDWHKLDKEQEIIQINQSLIDNQQEIFEFNIGLQLEKQRAEIAKISQAILTDKEIIELREKVVKNYNAQLKGGTLKYADYLAELTALNQAKLTIKTREIQRLMAVEAYNLTQGKEQN